VNTQDAQPRWLDEAEQRAWRAYLQMNAVLTAHLNREMQEDAGISLVDFAVLVPLSERPDGSMRARDLAGALGWEKSRLSHQVGRMERRGLVEKRHCAEDRRSAVVVLTDCGRRTIAAAAPTHVASVRRQLFDHLTGEQLAGLTAVAEGVVERLGPACAASGGAGCSAPI